MRDLMFFIVSSFSTIFLYSVLVWMAGILVVMFRELFEPGDFYFRQYLYKVWVALLYSFEIVAYCSVVISPIMMILTKKYTEYMIMTFIAVMLSSVYLYIRKKNVGFSFLKRKTYRKKKKMNSLK